MKNKIKLSLTLLMGLLMFAALTNKALAQNQKVWSGKTGGFRIDSTINPTSTIIWNLTLGTGSTSTKVDAGGRRGFTTVTWGNPLAVMIRDTIKANENINGCTGNVVNKPVDVFPLPIVSVGINDTICFGATIPSRTLTINNAIALADIGNFNLTLDLRTGSTTGPSVVGGGIPFTNVSTAITIPAITSSLAAGTYYLVITSFSSTIAATASNPAPGSVLTPITNIPTNYLVFIRPSLITPAIIAY